MTTPTKLIWSNEDAAAAAKLGFELRPSGITCVIGRPLKGSRFKSDEEAQEWVRDEMEFGRRQGQADESGSGTSIDHRKLCRKAVTMCMQER